MKSVLCFVGGVVLGACGALLGTKRYFEKKAEERINEEVASVRETYLKRAAAKDLADKNRSMKQDILEGRGEQGSDSDDGDVENDILEEDDSELSPDPEDPEEREIVEDIRHMRTRYNRNVFEDYGDQRPAETWTKLSREQRIAEEFDDGLADAERGRRKEAPYVITPEEFANEYVDVYDKVTIFYYQDHTAVDMSHYDEKVIDNLDRLIGHDIARKLGDLADEDGVVLVRNEGRSADYEIILQDENYIPDTAPVRD